VDLPQSHLKPRILRQKRWPRSTFKNWDLGGNGAWSPSEMCNYGQSRDWKLSLKGKDLNDNYDKNNMCPKTHAW